jgi:tetratricopeptide (TPR) repeat protein
MKNSVVFVFYFLLILIYSCGTTKSNVSKGKNKNSKLTEKELVESDFYFLDGARKKLINNIDDAISSFSNCLSIDKKNHAAMFALAKCLFQKGDYEGAIKVIQSAIVLKENNFYYKILLAEIYLRKNDVNNAILTYKKIIDQDPLNIDLYYDYANLLLSNNQLNEGVSVLDKIENNIGITEQISITKSQVYQKLKQPEKAYKEINNLILLFPDDVKYKGMLAEYYSVNNETEKAFKLYTEMLKSEPSNGMVHLSLGIYYSNKNENDKAFSEFKLAFADPILEIDSKIGILVNHYPFDLPSSKQNAFELINILMKTHKNDVAVLAIYVDYLIKNSQLNEARNQIRNLVKVDKKSILIWQKLLSLDLELQDYNGLFTESSEAIKYFPNEPFLYLFNGLSASFLNNHVKAIEILNIGLSLIIDNKKMETEFYSYLGESYYRIKNYESSDFAFDNVLINDPNNSLILNNYSYYLALRGDSMNKALKMIKRCLELEPESPTYLDTYAWVLYKLGDYEQAYEAISNSLRNGGASNATIIEHSGDILFKLGKKEQAVQAWIRAKEVGNGSGHLNEKIEKQLLIE